MMLDDWMIYFYLRNTEILVIQPMKWNLEVMDADINLRCSGPWVDRSFLALEVLPGFLQEVCH
jgi:hypothetical protein